MPELDSVLQNQTRPALSVISRSAIRQFDQQVSDIPGILKLTLGEPDLNTPEHVKQVLINAITNNASHYAPSAGLLRLRQAVSKYLLNSTNIRYNPASEILITIGATEAIFATMQTILSVGDEVIIPTPTFPLYMAIAKAIDATVIEIDTSDTDFVLTADALKQALQAHPNAKMLVLNYPTNPTGATYSKSKLTELAQVIQNSKLFVLADEIYGELSYDNKHYSIAELLPSRTILINGISKSYAMTGYRIGFLAAPATLTSNILKLHGFMVTTAPTSIMEGAIEALLHGQDDVAKMCEQYRLRRDYLVKELNQLNFQVRSPAGTFYLFAKIPINLIQNSNQLALQIAHQAKLAVIPGKVFGAGGEGYLRFSYAASMSNLHEAVRRLTKFVQEEK